MKLERGGIYPAHLLVEALIRQHRGSKAANDYRERRKETLLMAATATGSKAKWASAKKTTSAPFDEDDDIPGVDSDAPYIPDFSDPDAVLNIDFAQIADSTGDFANDVIAPGHHLAFVEAVHQEVSKTNKNPMLRVTLACYDGSEDGKRKDTYIVLKPDFVWKLKQFMAAVGIPVDQMGKYSINKLADYATGKMLGIQVVATEYNGNPSCDIKKLTDPTSFGVPVGAERPDNG